MSEERCKYCGAKKRGVSVNAKRVASLDLKTGKIVKKYNSLTDAKKDTGAEPACIRRVIKGQRNHAGGYRWKYLDV